MDKNTQYIAVDKDEIQRTPAEVGDNLNKILEPVSVVVAVDPSKQQRNLNMDYFPWQTVVSFEMSLTYAKISHVSLKKLNHD